MNRRTAIAAIGASLLASACMMDGEYDRPVDNRPPALTAGVLRGTVTYRERIALPPNARVEIKIVDAGRQDTRNREIATVTIPTRGRQVPIPFELRYPGDRPNQPAVYVVRARIFSGDRMLFINTARTPLPPRGRVDIVVSPVDY